MNILTNALRRAQRSLKSRPKLAELFLGFVLSVLLLCITDILYRIPFQHAADLTTYAYDVKLPAIDDRIPVLPPFFFGYIWSYAYWFFAPFFIIRTGKENTWDFTITYVVTLIACSLILYYFPTRMDRVAEGLWDPSRKGFFWDLLHICYNMDGGDFNCNLLPSMHCGNSVLYYQAMRRREIPYRFRLAALLSTILVIASTLLTKQHYFLDAVTGVLIPVIVRFAVIRVTRLVRTRASREAPGER